MNIVHWIQKTLVRQIIFAMCLGVIAGLLLPKTVLADGSVQAPYAQYFQILGDFFVKSLRAVAPVLIFVLIAHAISRHQHGRTRGLRAIIALYFAATLLSAAIAVLATVFFPITLHLNASENIDAVPQGLQEVLSNLLFKMADNPVSALVNGNYIGILVWAVLAGIVLRHAADSTRAVLEDAVRIIHFVVGLVIRLAPYGVFGLVTVTVATTGFSSFATYGRLIAVLIGSMVLVALVVNPLLVALIMKKNPYPLVWRCLTQSGIPAFFTRSSAANIPINLKLSADLGVREEIYSVSIPLGATINMAGAAITIAVLTLAAAQTLGIAVHPLNALLLCFLATLGAAGASGVPGGSLMLIPMACSLLSIDGDVAAQVVAIGVLIGVVQDSAETALNSSSDALFTAAVDLADQARSPAS